MTTIADAQALAIRHYLAGDLAQAEVICRQVLLASPANADSLHFLGVIAIQQGRPDLAVPHIQRSISLQPANPLFHANLGIALNALGQYDKAIPCFVRGLELDANSHESHSGLAFALSSRGEFDRAESHCRTALRIQPDSTEAWNTRGNNARLRGQWEEAVEYFRKAVSIDPRNSRALNNLAASLHTLGRKREAMAGYRQCLDVSPHYAGAHSNLAALLQEDGELDEAEVHLRQAVRLQPQMADAYNNLGGVLQLQSRLDEAIACFRMAESLSPNDPAAHSNLLMCLNYHPKADSASLLTEHRRWGQRFLNISKVSPAPVRDRDATRPLRVGYVSPDLMRRAPSNFIEPILTHHDPRHVEVYCYAEVTAPDSVTERMKKTTRGWRSTVGMTDAAIADLIRSDRIDILVDLAGHTAQSRVRVFAHKPAPVRVTYLGYPNTTGMDAVDYRLTDSITDPPGEAIAHTEELFRMPRAFCCYAPEQSDPPVNALPAERAGFVTFGSLHTLPRLNRGVLDTWSSILRAMPTAHLLIFRHTLRGKVRDELLRYFTSQGIAAERIALECTVRGSGGYASVYHNIDISLDTFPWSGHTTACQSLWMGVPIVTLRGSRFAGRMVASVLHHVGLPQLIAESPGNYAELAARLGSDISALAQLRANMRQQMSGSILCDATGFTRDLELSYRRMWQR